MFSIRRVLLVVLVPVGLLVAFSLLVLVHVALLLLLLLAFPR